VAGAGLTDSAALIADYTDFLLIEPIYNANCAPAAGQRQQLVLD
jgi:hypothetical protein